MKAEEIQHELEKLRSSLTRRLGTIAAQLSPIYLQLCKELAQADLICVDDIHTQVHQVTRAIKKGERPWEEVEEPAPKKRQRRRNK